MYVLCVMLFGVLVHLLLLLCADRLCRGQTRHLRTWVAAALGGIYNGLCLLDTTGLLSGILFRLPVLLTLGAFSSGRETGRLRKAVLFFLLHLALEGTGQGIAEVSGWTLLFGSFGVLFLCFLPEEAGLLVPVELSLGEQSLHITALRDTGNTLRDPVTGDPVLVVGADTACRLTGLSSQQLRHPVETMGTIPGLRLIPYKAVGGSGFLLGLRLAQVRIGRWQGSRTVAFSPEVLSSEGSFQALTGGMA